MPVEYLIYKAFISYVKRRVLGFFAAVILVAAGAFFMWQELVVTYVLCDEKSMMVLSYK